MDVKQTKFIYGKNIIPQVKEAVTNALKVRVISVRRIKQGEISYAFKVVTDKEVLLFKALKFKGWPDIEALEKVSKLLSRHGITHPTSYFYLKSTPVFPNGFLIQKYIEGEDCHKAILSGRLSFSRYHFLLGKLLRKIHSIKISNFGRLSKPLPKGTKYLEIRQKHLAKHLNEFAGTKLLDAKTLTSLDIKLCELLKSCKINFKPVLTHADATPDNCILTPKGELVLIDWDNAKASFWFEDFAWLTFCGSHMTSLGSLEHRSKIIWKEFFKGYGKACLSRKELKKQEYLQHLFKAASHLGYHYFAQGDKKAFKKTFSKLKVLLRK